MEGRCPGPPGRVPAEDRGSRQGTGLAGGDTRSFRREGRGVDRGSVSRYHPPEDGIQALFPLLLANTLPQRKLDESCGLGGLATSG